ncbi:hypothetical protein WJX72_009715 [[Myrmecia] bisecta]|uniref:FAD-binding PCMH-type domain-containing protein n=1 Tax=[Myrmecia] bisecta TaxID=41462 RepID=A0AAW1R8L1_9CHLO
MLSGSGVDDETLATLAKQLSQALVKGLVPESLASTLATLFPRAAPLRLSLLSGDTLVSSSNLAEAGYSKLCMQPLNSTVAGHAISRRQWLHVGQAVQSRGFSLSDLDEMCIEFGCESMLSVPIFQRHNDERCNFAGDETAVGTISLGFKRAIDLDFGLLSKIQEFKMYQASQQSKMDMMASALSLLIYSCAAFVPQLKLLDQAPKAYPIIFVPFLMILACMAVRMHWYLKLREPMIIFATLIIYAHLVFVAAPAIRLTVPPDRMHSVLWLARVSGSEGLLTTPPGLVVRFTRFLPMQLFAFALTMTLLHPSCAHCYASTPLPTCLPWAVLMHIVAGLVLPILAMQYLERRSRGMFLATRGRQLLRADVTGQVSVAGDSGYAKGVRGYSADPPGFAEPAPVAVVRPNGTGDVVAAIKLASAYNLTVGVKGGGHWPENKFLGAGGITIDPSSMNGVQIQPQAMRAKVQGGAKGGEVVKAAQAYDLGLPWGDANVTGMGLALNGGIGMSMRAHGLVCDNIVAAELVLANGTVLHVEDGEEHEDVLLAMRGAGTVFGVVTELTFKLFANASLVYGGNLILADDPDHSAFKDASGWAVGALEAHPGLGLETFLLLGAVYVTVVFHGNESRQAKAAVFEPLKQANVVVQDLLGKLDYYSVLDFISGELVAPLLNANLTQWFSGLMSKDQVLNGGTEGLLEAYDLTPAQNGTLLLTAAHLSQNVGGAANLASLRRLKTQLDPTNFFRNHQLIGFLPSCDAPSQGQACSA